MNSRPYESYVSLDDLMSFWKTTTTWENEALVRAALVSLELSFLLIADAHRDTRRTVRKRERIARLWHNATEHMRLLADLLSATRALETASTKEASNTTNVCLLHACDHGTRWIRQFADAYDTTIDEMPFKFGIEPEINRLRAAHGLPQFTGRAERPYLPYDAWIAPERITSLFNRRSFNAEDRLFATTHQCVECWMFIVLGVLAAADVAIANFDYARAAQAIDRATAILSFLSESILVLETMVLADYHPLRVRLRDASGAQSKQVAAAVVASRQLEARFGADIARRNLSYLTIYRRPADYLGEHALVESLTTLDNRFARFLFNHYKLASRILGTKSIGSLGVEVQALVSRFVQPFFSDLDYARYRYGVMMSFAYGQYAGNLVTELERAEPPSIPLPVPVNEARIREVIDSYFEAMCSMDIERWVALFSIHASVESPAGSRPYCGQAGVRVFFRNFMKVFEPDVRVTKREIRIDAGRGRAEVDWLINVRHEGLPISYSGTECFEFTESGELLRVVVHDDPMEIAQQMLPSSARHEYPSE